MRSRGVTIVVHVDGDPNTRKYHLPLWAFDAGKWAAVTLAVLVVLFFAFAEPLTHAAARVPGLEGEVARLTEENVRVRRLAGALTRAEANYQELRQLLEPSPEQGSGRAAPIPTPGPAATRAATVEASPPLEDAPAAAPVTSARATPSRYEAGPSEPRHWPLDVGGFVTRGQVVPGDPAESHPGIDIAVPEGSNVRAAGGGTVEQAGTDTAYGQFVLLRHPSGYQSMYGHASRLMVQPGDTVQAGQVIALSGSSGRSTAPHLHFEIRLDGKTIDPLTMVKQEK